MVSMILLHLLETQLVKQSAGEWVLEDLVTASLPREPSSWLQQPCSPIIYLHNGCLLIHYANGMRGKLGSKGRRKEKIALACFNILFISKCSGLQKAAPQRTLCAWELGFTFLL